MRYSSTKDDRIGVTSNSVSRGLSDELWPALELLQEAEAVGVEANRIINTLLRGGARGFFLECERQLRQTGLYSLAIGDWKPRLGFREEKARQCCELFWSSLRGALYDQFRGFAVPDDQIKIKIREAAVLSRRGGKRREEPNPNFWAVSEQNTISRIWILIAHAKLLKGTASYSTTASHQTETARVGQRREENMLDLSAPFLEARDILLKLTKTHDKELTGSNQERSFERVRSWAVLRLLNRYAPIPKHDDQHDHDLVQEFLLLLSRGAGSALSVEVSLLMRILVGRYLNDSNSRLEWAKESMHEGVRYVLRQQNELDGSWEIPVPKTSSSPFLHRFSPLLDVLDLDTELLRPEGAALVQACARALAWARRALSVQHAAAQEACIKPNQLDIGHLTDSVVMGLSLGRTVYDRLKDLLSDSTLRHRGAVDGHTDLELKDIPNSLGFRANIDKGVLNEWRTRSGLRPGAILIYGPPGTGKTTVASIIASELNKFTDQAVGASVIDRWRFLTLSAADFARDGSDGIVAYAEQLFRELKRVRRCVVLLDEMEEFLRARGPGSDRDSRLVTTAFLPLLQEVVTAREVILVVATNFVGSIDAAVTRQGRFDLILPLGPPGQQDRKYILDHHIPDYKKVLEFLRKFKKPTDWFEKAIIDYSMGYSRTELRSFFREFFGMIEAELLRGSLPDVLQDSHKLRIELWRIRADRVPVALSGRAGSDWRTFEDEAKRYHRCVPEVGLGDEGKLGDEAQLYWREPALPL